MKSALLAMLLAIAATAAKAQTAPDFAQKFMSLCTGDTSVTCITISPKMMEQLKQDADEMEENLEEALTKIKSARVVKAPAAHYERALTLVRKHSRRFRPQQNFATDSIRGGFYTRTNRDGDTVELVMLRQDDTRNSLTIVCLTGDLDEQFLCFLYNNKTLKN